MLWLSVEYECLRKDVVSWEDEAFCFPWAEVEGRPPSSAPPPLTRPLIRGVKGEGPSACTNARTYTVSGGLAPRVVDVGTGD